jgi:uncharacterized protein YdaU (DUF1376 family)
VNYYEHHIGDYDSETAHLSWLEDMAYTRLIRLYYRKECPIPADLAVVCRKIRAVSKQERQAVEDVLAEFFTLEEDGWHQKTCDENIAAFLAGEPEREAKKANEETRLKRHREERAALFQALTAAGQHAPWNIGIKELRELVKSLTATAAIPPPATPPATAPATLATATQTPIPSTQYPVLNSKELVNPEPSARAATATELSIAMRKGGIQTQPADPRLIALAEQGVTPETVAAACAEAKQAKPDEQVGLGYVVAIIERWAKKATAMNAAGASPPTKKSRHSGFDKTDYTEGVTEDGRIA